MIGNHDNHGRYYSLLLLILFISLVLLIGMLQILIGPELAFSFFYLVPIIAVTWLVNRQAGVLVSFLSALSWLMADLFMIERFSSFYIPLINEILRLSIFLFIVFIISRYKTILKTQQELAMLDPLTNIANRRAFFQLAHAEIDRSRRYDYPFSLLVIDIDDFKQINDHWGHDTGDHLLFAVADTIKRHVRAIDVVARFGGDEFVVLLVRTDERSALMVTQKLQRALLDKVASNKWRVTFSIGLAICQKAPGSINDVIQAADELMYQVKHGGKNSIRHAVLNPEKGLADEKM